jgi:hypothetical protein
MKSSELDRMAAHNIVRVPNANAWTVNVKCILQQQKLFLKKKIVLENTLKVKYFK